MGLAGAVARAQDEVPQQTASRMRPVDVSFDIRGTYTDNRDSTSNAESCLDLYANPKIHGFLLRRSPNVLDFYYGPSFRWRDNPSDIQNETELFHDVGVTWLFTPEPALRVMAKDNFNYTDDPEVRKGGTTLRSDSTYYLNRAEGALDYIVNPLSHVNARVSNLTKRYTDDVRAKESDEDIQEGSVLAVRQVSSTIGAALLADAARYEYANAESIDRGFTAIMGGVGIETLLRNDLRGGVRAGWKLVDYSDEELGSEGVPHASVTLDTLNRPVSLQASVTYSLRDSDVFPYASQKYTDFYAHLAWDTRTKFGFGLSGTYRIGDYSEDTVPTTDGAETPVASGGGTEYTTMASAEVVYHFSDITAGRFVQSFEDVSSDVDVSFTRNTSMLVLSREFF